MAVLAMGLMVGTSRLAASGEAASQAAPCSQAGLQKAFARGGTYKYRASCTVQLTKTLTQPKGTLILDGDGHTVVFKGTTKLTGPAIQIKAGYFTLGNVEVEDVVVRGEDGKRGAEGEDGTTPQGGTVVNGTAGGDGKNGANGGAVDGSAVSAAKGSTVTLDHDTFYADSATGGDGGDGGAGGDGGGNGQGGGNGGAGGKGGKGGSGGTALGGAVYSAGTLTVIGGLFKDDEAVGGVGMWGGVGGEGGQGGGVYPNANHLHGGDGGAGGQAGNGGAAYGGALYASSRLTVKGTRFIGDEALGGTSFGGLGIGGDGGDIAPNGQLGDGGTGGNGGAGGNGGKAGGGAIDDLGSTGLAGAGFSGNGVSGGHGGSDCPRSGDGCGSAGGQGGDICMPTGGCSGYADSGSTGADGKAGDATAPDFPSFNKNSGLPLMSVTTRALPSAVEHRSYSVTLAAKGGIRPYTWTITKLPKGLSATKAGVISGRPNVSGTFTVSIKVTDPTAAERTTGRATLKLVVKK